MKKVLAFSFLLLTISTSVVFAQDKKDQKPAAGQPSDKEMAAWMAYMTPGKYHTWMASSNGTWNTEITMWMAPGAPPQTSKGTTENTMILGGRYQQSMHKGEMDGMPFEGTATTAYDNNMKKFITTWIDNMGTGLMYMEGVYNDPTKSVNYTGKMMDPMTGKMIAVREVFTMVDENTQTLDMFINNGGKEFQTMHIKYTRVR